MPVRLWNGAEAGPPAYSAQAREVVQESHFWRGPDRRRSGPRITNPGIFARLRSFASNILRFNQQKSIRQDRYAAALGGYAALVALRFG